MKQSQLSKKDHSELLSLMTIEPGRNPITNERVYVCHGRTPGVVFHVIGKTREEAIDKAFDELLRPF